MNMLSRLPGLSGLSLLSTLPWALAVASTTLACSSSGSPAAPSDDGGSSTTTTPDSSTTTPGPDSSTSPPPTSDDAGNVTDSGGGGVDAGPLSFSTDIYAAIIDHHCIGCHSTEPDGGLGSGLAYGKLDMSSVDAGYANLVNVAAAGVACGETDGAASPIRVVPGSSATSLLYAKVNGFTTAPPCGDPMPKSGEIPDGGQAIVVQQIQTWIDQGALP